VFFCSLSLTVSVHGLFHLPVPNPKPGWSSPTTNLSSMIVLKPVEPLHGVS
jgi:hypothetical protein